MEAAGFVRHLLLGSKKVALPHATYKLEDNLSATAVKDKAVTIAKTIWDNPLVVVVEFEKGKLSTNLK